jgi:predicted DNA-binding helix-hairpin-helix protein
MDFFLSSGIDKDANETQEKMIDAVRILRKKYEYKGYIHLKILPGVDDYLIKKATYYSDRLSINMESVSSHHLKKISNEKEFVKNLLKPLKKLFHLNLEKPLKSGITTQVIVGSSDEKDIEILSFSYYLYKNFNLRRVYYSGFIPVINTPLENKNPCSLKRQTRIYQADILIRRYKFLPKEIPVDENGNLYLDKDPKLLWAERNKGFFPVEINKADFYQLIRIPGIGVKVAEKIINERKNGKIKYEETLEKIGVNLKRAGQFITLNGKKITSLL